LERQILDHSAISFDLGPYPRARIGFVCVANAGLTEGDMMRMRPEGVGLSFTHLPMATQCTIESLSGMEQDLEATLRGFLPGRDDIDVLCYNCTAGSFVIGEANICAKLEAGRTGVRGTTLLTGVVEALRHLDVRRIALGTAYTDDINALEHDYFAKAGFEVPVIAGLGLMTDVEMNQGRTRLSPRLCHITRPTGRGCRFPELRRLAITRYHRGGRTRDIQAGPCVKPGKFLALSAPRQHR
jgi:maleate isomerase